MIYNIIKNDERLNKANSTTNSNLSSHIKASNPHNISKSTLGLGNVDNTADADKSVKSAGNIKDNECSFTPAQIKERFKKCLQLVDIYQKSITLDSGATFFEAIPSNYQQEAYIYMINCSGNSCNFVANMEKYHMAVKNVGSGTLSTTVQVYIMAEDVY